MSSVMQVGEGPVYSPVQSIGSSGLSWRGTDLAWPGVLVRSHFQDSEGLLPSLQKSYVVILVLVRFQWVQCWHRYHRGSSVWHRSHAAMTSVQFSKVWCAANEVQFWNTDLQSLQTVLFDVVLSLRNVAPLILDRSWRAVDCAHWAHWAETPHPQRNRDCFWNLLKWSHYEPLVRVMGVCSCTRTRRLKKASTARSGQRSWPWPKLPPESWWGFIVPGWRSIPSSAKPSAHMLDREKRSYKINRHYLKLRYCNLN